MSAHDVVHLVFEDDLLLGLFVDRGRAEGLRDARAAAGREPGEVVEYVARYVEVPEDVCGVEGGLRYDRVRPGRYIGADGRRVDLLRLASGDGRLVAIFEHVKRSAGLG